MLRKTIIVVASIGIVAALTMIPISATADTFRKCPPGVTDPTYCTKVKKCVVPNVVGKHLNDAKKLLRKHDCKRGKIKIQETYLRGQKPPRNPTEAKQKQKDDAIEQGWEKGVVVKQKRKPGKVLKRGAKVGLRAEY